MADMDEIQQKPRVMYLDVDDTLLVFNKSWAGFGAPMVAEFIHWALEHFEVRWLTSWCPSGIMLPVTDGLSGAENLSYRLNYGVSTEILASIKNPKEWFEYKTEAVDFEDPRPWVWVEDGLVYKERELLNNKNLLNNFYPTNVSIDIRALQITWKRLADRFELLCPCKHPWSKEMTKPTILPPSEERLQEIIDFLAKSK
jgi:hypothetical protein